MRATRTGIGCHFLTIAGYVAKIDAMSRNRIPLMRLGEYEFFEKMLDCA
jgi:hypothetical protein